MKKSEGFWRSLEQYSWRVVVRSPLPRYWTWIGVGVVGIILVMSAQNVKNSVVSARSEREVIEKAVQVGDYQAAERLYSEAAENVLGTESELEKKVYPERVVEKRTTELEQKLEKYPGDKEILLEIARLYGETGNIEKAQEYQEQARILDPNDPIFQP